MEPADPSEKQPSRRLLFDRRYGWVFDEWKDPSEEALAGGRGMFCVVPLAKVVFSSASVMINNAASLAVKVFEKPDLSSLAALQTSLNEQVTKLKSSLQKPESSRSAAVAGNSPSQI